MVAVLQRGHQMPIFHKLDWFFRVFLKCSQWSCKTTPFLSCRKQLCSQRLVSVHISIHANEHCSPHPSLLWKWSSLSFNFLTKPALNCPSFRKQSGVKWFAQPDINELMKVKWSDVCMGVNPGGDMSPPIRGLSPPKKIFQKITLSIVKNICMYTYNNLSRKKNAKSAFRNSWVPPPLPHSGLAHCLLSQFISPTPHTSQVCGCGSVNVELQ